MDSMKLIEYNQNGNALMQTTANRQQQVFLHYTFYSPFLPLLPPHPPQASAFSLPLFQIHRCHSSIRQALPSSNSYSQYLVSQRYEIFELRTTTAHKQQFQLYSHLEFSKAPCRCYGNMKNCNIWITFNLLINKMSSPGKCWILIETKFARCNQTEQDFQQDSLLSSYHLCQQR